MKVSDFLTDTGDWHCTQCGHCCKIMHLVPELTHLDRGDSVCVHLSEENQCNIYDTRPERCRISVAFGNEPDPIEVAETCYRVACASMGYHGEVR